MDANAIEAKWRKRWAEEKCFEPDLDASKEKRYITAAFPYPNSPQHIGHGRTYTTADIYARYLRLRGFHVLFPMAFHVTGTPILAMAKRIAKKDKEVLEVFENIYGIDAKTAESLTDPEALVTYFSKEIEQGMKEIGYSMDWRRKFYSFDPKFNKFIQWQFRKLKELGYLIKGEYPIAWCPSDGNALSAHDTKGDVDPELEDVTVIKFRTGKGQPSLVVTTYRPETIYGVTNIWVNPDAEYVKAEYKGEQIYIAKKAAEVLNLQMKLKILGDVDADKLLRLEAENPMDGKKVPVYEASFVSPEVGTGIVMSVPAHAPLDYLALRDLGKGDMEMPQVLFLKGYSSMPAKDAVEKLGVKDQDDPTAEEATKEIYTKEAHEGVMVTGKYKGQKGIDAKVKIAKDLEEANSAFQIVTLANGPVFCRCGTQGVVNILKDQWFIDYGQPEWKKKAMECLGEMSTIPAKTRDEYVYTIDWLKTRPCTRASGLGTRFPFDESKMIEALSDSTIYMAFYTISHMLGDFEPEALGEAFFDYVLLGKGKPKGKDMEALRKSFLYWYPVDSRHSAGDLIRNHLTLYIFNHVGIFEKKLWPRQIVTNGFVTMDGAKMSKSMGNILPLRKAIREYGADVVRFSVVCGADLTHDTDFNRTVADGMRGRLAFINELIAEAARQKDGKEHSRADKWLLSRLNRRIKRAQELYEQVAIRHLALEIFYDLINDLHWYDKRTKERNLHGFFRNWAVMIAPFMPHLAEEWWSMLGGKGLVSFAQFPEPDEKLISDEVEKGEELVRSVHEDIDKISKLIGKKPGGVFVYVAGNWKRKAYELLKKEKSFDGFMKGAYADAELKPHMKELTGMAKQLMKNVHSLPDILGAEEELASLKDAQMFLSEEFGCTVTVLPDSEGKHPKAKNASPNKPAIVIE
ncbi:MAG: leucine--tRNA ligase [Candidatus Micrarchaeota archaeon]